MDSNRFDDLTRTLATTPSRRGFLKTLAGGAAGALLATFGVGEASAKDCTKTGKKCQKPKDCCTGNCVNGICTACITPNTMSSYVRSCYNEKLTCDSSGTTLSADCEDSFGDPLPTSIIVNTCSSSNYVIANCNAKLTCGRCNP